ncbi:hypothetical protein L7F22_011003 [Adiantum nelumboides]|nr:hypothetical protein [Adiantum nelumboides]
MYYCPHPRRIDNFRVPRNQVSPPRERQQQQSPFPIQQAPPVQILRPPVQPKPQHPPLPPTPIAPISPLPILKNRVVNVINLDTKVKAEEEERGKSLPKEKGKAKVEDVDAMPIKRARQEEAIMSETGERRKGKEIGESNSKKKSKPRLNITIKDFSLAGEDAQEFLDNLEIACLVTWREDDTTRLRVFPLLIKVKAKAWFNTLLPANRGDWTGLRVLFLAKFGGGGETSEILWGKAMAEKQTEKYVQCLRSDGGGDYFSNEFSSFLKKHGIQRQFTCRYTPQQNGVAERKNRHIVEVARALMAEKNVPRCYWAKAVSTAMYIMNKTPTAAVHNVTPEENFSGKRPDLGHLKLFGCIAYLHVPDELQTKLDPKAEKCIFIGYSLEQKGYKCYNPITPCKSE